MPKFIYEINPRSLILGLNPVLFQSYSLFIYFLRTQVPKSPGGKKINNPQWSGMKDTILREIKTPLYFHCVLYSFLLNEITTKRETIKNILSVKRHNSLLKILCCLSTTTKEHSLTISLCWGLTFVCLTGLSVRLLVLHKRRFTHVAGSYLWCHQIAASV